MEICNGRDSYAQIAAQTVETLFLKNHRYNKNQKFSLNRNVIGISEWATPHNSEHCPNITTPTLCKHWNLINTAPGTASIFIPSDGTAQL